MLAVKTAYLGMLRCQIVTPLCWIVCVTEKHGLSFLETSALDSSNVELAFQTILTGESHKSS